MDFRMFNAIKTVTYGVLPVGSTLLLYGSLVRDEADSSSDIDLWILHDSIERQKGFSRFIPPLRAMITKATNKVVALENDCWPHFVRRLEFADPWSVTLLKQAIAIVDPDQRWITFQERTKSETRPELNYKETAAFYAAYLQETLHQAVNAGHEFFARLHLFLSITGAAKVAEETFDGDESISWSDLSNAMQQDRIVEKIAHIDLAAAYETCRKWSGIQTTWQEQGGCSLDSFKEFLKALSEDHNAE